MASNGSTLTVASVAKGTARDTDGNRVSNAFEMTVVKPPEPEQETPPEEQEKETPNRAPTVSAALPDVSRLKERATRDISLSGVFNHADGDALTFTAVASHHHVASMWLSEDYTLTLVGTSKGTATLTVTAWEADGNRANPVIWIFYTRLVVRGKPKKVALVAAMHKLLILLNAVMRDQTPWRIPPQTMPGT